MVNIVTLGKLDIDYEKIIVQGYRCNKCASLRLRPLAFVRGQNNSAFLVQCIECYDIIPFVFTKEPLSTPDAIIDIVENVGELNIQLQKESNGICPQCKIGSYRIVDSSKCNRMALDIITCNKCNYTVPIISIVRNTLLAYSYDMQLAKKVGKKYPEIALVFCVAALETYFRQLFQYHSELNSYLVKQRRVNFQSLDETKTIIKKEFGIDIIKLVKNDWSFLCEDFKKRHYVIHNASHDMNGRNIKISKDEITKLYSVVDDLVYKIEMTLFYNNVVI